MAKLNYLLGKGERLTNAVTIKGGPVVKEPPYTFAQVKHRVAPMLERAVKSIDLLPAAACPDDKAVASVTLNPEYLAKSYYPAELFRSAGLTAVGSKPRRITPQGRSKGRPPEETVTTELFVMGTRENFRRWSRSVPGLNEGSRVSNDLMTVEEVAAPAVRDKIKGTLPESGDAVLEVVLHVDALGGDHFMLPAFRRYIAGLGIDQELERKFYAGGLCFVELDAPVQLVEQIATFAPVRALREMPKLRILRPAVRTSGIVSEPIDLPTEAALDPSLKVAIFDGGIPDHHPITAWATPIAQGVGRGHQDLARHGLGVTSAFLFGHLTPGVTAPRPFANVDHYRVLDLDPGQNKYELYEVLARIDHVLATTPYDFINLSIGPELAIRDDDVHAWTAVLDDRLSRTDTFASVAVGNGGEGDESAALNRIQVPSDCVNAISVGAADRPDAGWRRAPYSSVGPGRSPGLMKPDLVEFGGSIERPFLVLSDSSNPLLEPTGGTSFAAPSLLRLATGVRAHLGSNIGLLAVRALMVHGAEIADHPRREVGWGRVPRTIEEIILCADDTVRVIYQGEISPAKSVRALIPLPAEPLTGMVEIGATLCYKSLTDPHHPGNYTRAGLDLTFRPHDGKRRDDKQTHANTKSFFGDPGIERGQASLSRAGFEWENVQHAHRRFKATTLNSPCFDIHYNARLEGRGFEPEEQLPYALVVTVRARQAPDLYDRVLRRWGTTLEAMRPVIDIPVRT